MTDRKSKEPGAGGDEDSFLDSVMAEEGAEGDGEEYGLELDDSQAQEVRQIFFTTLPQYLQPIEEMLEQLFAADELPTDLTTALATTVSSIGAAAARLGIEAVREPLELMQDEITQLEGYDRDAFEHARKRLFAALGQLTALTVDPTAPAKPRAQTIIAAFKHIEDVDRSVLEKLTAAGLVTVDQIEMAEPREIAAVTGLDMSVVRALISALARARPAADEPLAAAQAPSRDGLEALEAELQVKLRARVEIEAEVEETRAHLARLRLRKTSLQRELTEARARRAALLEQLDAAREGQSAKLAELAALRGRRDALEHEQAAARHALELTAADTAKLDQERRAAYETQAALSDQLAQLGARVRRMLDVAGARGSFAHARTTSPPDES